MYRYHFETGENEVFVSKEEAKAAYGKDVFSLSCGMSVKKEFCLRYGTEKIKDCF